MTLKINKVDQLINADNVTIEVPSDKMENIIDENNEVLKDFQWEHIKQKVVEFDKKLKIPQYETYNHLKRAFAVDFSYDIK